MFARIPTTGRVLIVEADQPLGALYADLIRTHCPGTRVDFCAPTDHSLIQDNCGGADLAILSCSPQAASLDSLRELLTLRACLAILVLAPADRPHLADAAIAAGATDVLLRAPGYLDQIAVCVRKNIMLSKARTAEHVRHAAERRQLQDRVAQIAALHRELAATAAPAAIDQPFPGTIHIPQRSPRPATARAA